MRTRSSACAPRDTCESSASGNRHRRARRSRQIDADRAAAARDRFVARRQGRRADRDQRTARRADRVELRARCAAGRTRSGDHDRHDPHLVHLRRSPLRDHRRAGPPPVHQQHAQRRSRRRGRDPDRRRRRGRQRTDASPRVPARDAGHRADHRRDQQDGPREIRRDSVPGVVARGDVAAGFQSARAGGHDSDLRSRGRQPGPPRDDDAVVRRADDRPGARIARRPHRDERRTAAHPRAGRLPLRHRARRGRPHRVGFARGRRPGDGHAVARSAPTSRRCAAGRPTERRSPKRANRSASCSISRSSSNAATS